MTNAIPRTRWATTVDGVSIAYQDFGEGEPALVIIHGFISHLEVYWEERRYAAFMHRLSRNMRVLTFDKRGTGMSDRLAQAPDLDTRMDDVRAVLDAAGVERAALLGWGTGGPPLALFFAATHPERTVAVCTDGNILEQAVPGYPWGYTEAKREEELGGLVATWGDPDTVAVMASFGFGDGPGDVPRDDPEFLPWLAKICRYSATPEGVEAFYRVWWDTDVRDILEFVRAPTAVLYRRGAGAWGGRDQAAYLADRLPAAELVGVDGSAPVIWIEDAEAYVRAVEAFLDVADRHDRDLDRVLATVLFTDIVGSTDMAAKLGDRAWKDLIEHHHTAVRTLLGRYRGTELNTTGDGFYASFDGPARAVRCALAISDTMRSIGLKVRAGVHTGEVEMIEGQPGGMAVHIGARIAAMADADEVLVSRTVNDLVVGSGLTFENRGEHELKGVPGTWQILAAVRA